MSFDDERLRSWSAIAVALLVACCLGFLVARWTAPAPEAAASVAAESLSDSVVVTPAGLKAMSIATETVVSGNLSAEVVGPGTVDPEIRGEAILMAHVAGTVASITGRVGDLVKAGDKVAVVSSRDAAAIAAAEASANAKLALARTILAREKTLFDKQVVAREELENAQATFTAAEAEARQAATAAAVSHVQLGGAGVAVVSPLAGAIVSRTAVLGQFVQPETELFRVADPSDIDVDVAVPALDAQRVHAGDVAKVRTRAGVLVNAKVRSVTPTLNDETRSATVILDPLPKQPALMPGDLVNVEIIPKTAIANGVVVPAEAVQMLDGRDVVFLKIPSGFKAIPVTVAARAAGRAEIASGLEPGQTIATTNAFFLKAEMRKPTGEDE